MKRPVPGRVYPGGPPSFDSELESMIVEAKANETKVRIRTSGILHPGHREGATPEERARDEERWARNLAAFQRAAKEKAHAQGVEVEWVEEGPLPDSQAHEGFHDRFLALVRKYAPDYKTPEEWREEKRRALVGEAPPSGPEETEAAPAPSTEEATFQDWAKLAEEGEALVRAAAEKLTPANVRRLPRGWWRDGKNLTFALRHWVVSRNCPCPHCRWMYEGNGWLRKGQRFVEPDTGEPYDGPPLHGDCRCDTMTVTVTVDAATLAARRP